MAAMNGVKGGRRFGRATSSCTTTRPPSLIRNKEVVVAKCEVCGKPAHDGCCEGCIISHEYEERRSTCVIGPDWLRDPAFPAILEEMGDTVRKSQRRRKKK